MSKWSRPFVVLLALGSALVGAPLAGEEGSIDLSFATQGVFQDGANVGFPRWDHGVTGVSDAAGRLYLAGNAFTGIPFSSNAAVLITRSLPDGSLDPTFAVNGALRWSLATNNASRALLPTAAGQLLFLARLTSPTPFGPAPIFFVVGRLHEDGTLDPTWGAGGIATPDLDATFVDAVHAVLDPQGRVLVAGTRAITLGSMAEVFLARLDAGGALDPSFAGSGWQGVTVCGSSLTTVSDLEILANGQAAVAVTCGSAGASSAQILYFTPDSGAAPELRAVPPPTGSSCLRASRLGRRSPTQLYLAAEDCTPGVGAALLYALPAATEAAASALAPVVVAGGSPFGLVTVGDGRLYYGWQQGANAFVARLNSLGAPDPTFATLPLTFGTTNEIFEELISHNGRPVVVGSLQVADPQIDFEIAALRLASDTLFADNFEAGFGRWSVVTGLAAP